LFNEIICEIYYLYLLNNCNRIQHHLGQHTGKNMYWLEEVEVLLESVVVEGFLKPVLVKGFLKPVLVEVLREVLQKLV
jgi:hypothetical protein